MGPDGMPYWYLRLAAPSFARPIAHLFSTSISTSIVPTQWKQATIMPLPKIPLPSSCADYRPISLTPILSRLLERLVLRQYLHPAIEEVKENSNSDQCNLDFSNQFAYLPTGSTTAALTYLLHTITSLLETNSHVHVISCDFSKAFDTIRHDSLLHKLANLPIPDSIFNWIKDFLTDRVHTTRFSGQVSTKAFINAGVVQGSALGPVAFIVSASDYRPLTKGNAASKYADDTYLIVPAINTSFIPAELDHLASWALCNNLRMNPTKSSEMVIRKPRCRAPVPPLLPGLPRVDTMKVLGVTLQPDLRITAHVNELTRKAGQTLYALKTIKANGLSVSHMDKIAGALLTQIMTYASPAWWGFSSAEDKVRLQALLNKAKKWGLCTVAPTLALLAERADDKLFRAASSNPLHLLHQLLPPLRNTRYALRARAHPFIIPPTSNMLSKTFLHRLLNKSRYTS
jgi:hypothetical protein